MAACEPVTVRDDLRALEGYHSPQVDVACRLNTNESPVPPPAAWRDAFAAELSRVEWHRYPDRAATALRDGIAELHGVRADQVFAANGSNEVLQTLLLTYRRAGPHRGHVRADLPAARPHRPAHRRHGGRGRARRRLHASTSTGGASSRPSIVPRSRSCARPNNPTGLVEPEANVRAVLAARARSAGGRRGVRAVRRLVGARRWSTTTTPLVVTRTFSKTWSMAGARLGYLVGPSWLVAELDKVVLPYHLDAAKQIAGRLALQLRRRDGRPGAADRRRARAALGGARRSCRSTCSRAAPTSSCSGRVMPAAGRVWQALLDRSVLIRDCSGWPRLADCLRVTVGTPDENDAFLAALTEVVA